MDGKIDWVSFTLPLESDILSPDDLIQIADYKLMMLGRDWYEQANDGTDFKPVSGRAPYRFAVARSDGGVRIFGGGHTETILFEFSGRGCDGIRNHATASRLLSAVSDRVTRFDYAVDIRTGTLPGIFVAGRETKAFRSISRITSDSGQTVYLGSPKSDRFARVYRYNPPHPRHRLLRVEFVFRRKLAKAAVRHYADAKQPETFIDACGNTWGLHHPDWRPDISTDERIKTESRSRASDQTVHWLYSQVAPAIARLVREDSLNIADFLEHVYTL